MADIQTPTYFNQPSYHKTTTVLMADDAPRALLCIIRGDPNPFIVEPTGSLDIIDLREMIKKENSNYLQSVHGSADSLEGEDDIGSDSF